jgi:hypothetical protein
MRQFIAAAEPVRHESVARRCDKPLRNSMERLAAGVH